MLRPFVAGCLCLLSQLLNVVDNLPLNVALSSYFFCITVWDDACSTVGAEEVESGVGFTGPSFFRPKLGSAGGAGMHNTGV